MVSAEKMQYDGFLSYSAASDYQTARRVEAFLEAFHKLAPPAGAAIRQLHVCRDGSDFKLPKLTRRESADEDPIWEIIVSQLIKAKYLLVLCSPAATKSPWVAREVSWFIENRGRDSVLPLVTAGLDPIRTPQECFPEGLIAAGIHRERIWYDLRGRRSNVRGEGVRDHEDEMVRIASDLLDWDAQTFGPLSTLWQREQLKVRRRQATLVSSVAAVMILLAGFATWKAFQAREEAILARIASLISTAGSQRDPMTSVLILNEAASLAGNSAPYGATNIAAHLARTIRPMVVLRGHQAAVVSVAFNRLGDKLLTASQDGTARIWPADFRGSPTVLSSSGASLVDAAFSHDDRLIVAASADGTARIWSTDGTTAPVVLRGHEQALRAARFSPDDTLVITASENATARIWSVAGGSSLQVLRGHNAAVRSAVFNSKGDRVVTASDDGTSKVWSTNGTSQPMNFGFPWRVKFSSASFSPDGRTVIVASSDGTGWIWSPADEFPFITLVGGSISLSSAAFSPNGKWIVTAQLGRVHVWKTDGLNPLSKTNESYLSFDTHSLVRKAVFSPDSTRVAAVAEDGSARVWTIDGSQEVLLMGSHEAPVLDVAFSPDGARLATASSDSTIRIWEVAPASEPVIADVHRGPIAGVQFDSNAGRPVTRTKDSTIWLWRREGGKFVQTGHDNEPVRSVSLSPSGRNIVTVTEDGTVALLDADKFQQLFRLPGTDSGVRAASVNNEATILAISEQNSVQLRRVDEKGPPLLLRGHQGRVNSARFSPDDSRVVTAGQDKTVRVWRTDGKGDPVVFSGHQGTVIDAVFSRDGRYIVSVSDDTTARVWDTTGKIQPRILGGHSGPVFSAAFSEDGTKVVTGSVAEAKVWRLDTLDVPIELNTGSGRVLAVSFNRDGTETLTGTDDGRLWIWHTDWRWLVTNNGRATHACLSADQRAHLLGEIPLTAQAEYRKCQRLLIR